MRVAPRETIKLLDISLLLELMAILPAATAEFHLNGYVPYHGDKVAGIDRSSFKTESGLLVMLN